MYPTQDTYPEYGAAREKQEKKQTQRVRYMEEREAGTKNESPKLGLTSARVLILMFPGVRSPYYSSD